jgi:hypothetical protein
VDTIEIDSHDHNHQPTQPVCEESEGCVETMQNLNHEDECYLCVRRARSVCRHGLLTLSCLQTDSGQESHVNRKQTTDCFHACKQIAVKSHVNRKQTTVYP